MAIDFPRIAATLLQRAPELLRTWFPAGKQVGHEFVVGNLAGEAGRSLSINITTGVWKDFAGDAAGGDLTSLYAAIHGLDQGAAARQLAPEFCNGAAGAPLPAPSLTRPPPDAPPIPDHPRHGAAAAQWAYRDAHGVLYHTARYDLPDGSKQFAWLTWDGARWRLKSPAKPRALYGLDRLAAAPASAAIVITEGEKCADAAAQLLPSYVAMTWAGGASAIDTADWTPLTNRAVFLWPDADEPGRAAMAKLSTKLLSLGCQVSAIDPADAPHAWDAADALAEGWDTARVVEWIRPRIKSLSQTPQTKIGRPRGDDPPVESAPTSALATWQSLGIELTSSGRPEVMEDNVARVLEQHPSTRGKIWFDSFRQEVWHCLRGVPQAWDDRQTRKILQWLQRDLKMSKFSKHHVHDGVLMYAESNERNSVHEFIESEPWDGIVRREEWLSDFLGCPNDEHHRAAGSNWVIGMVARAYDPGCQLRHMLILEGAQDKGKSSVLRALAEPWYATVTQRFGSKEFSEAIQSKWLIELADLTALAGARHAHILAGITDRSDRYRAPWDKLASDHDRRCVFAGSTEQHNNYLADTYGISRFWSIRCGDINVAALKAVRQQLFAEALVQYLAGVPYHLMPQQTRDEQVARVEVDAYVPRVQEFLADKSETTALDIFEAIFVQRDDFGRMIGRTIMDSRDEKRIAKILR